MTKALVILSGGQDSTTALYWAMARHTTVHAVSFDYGQRHTVELKAARTVADMAGVASFEVISMRGLLVSTSPLLDPSATLETYTDYTTMDRIIGNRTELTFVPMRNLAFLTVAANRAVSLGCDTLVMGICQADNANYPDCRASFADLAEAVINEALGRGALQIATPLMDHDKAETVRLAASLPGCLDALAYSHTCYAGAVPPCGVCHACTLRAHGFAEAAIADPLVMRCREAYAPA